MTVDITINKLTANKTPLGDVSQIGTAVMIKADFVDDAIKDAEKIQEWLKKGN